MSTRCTVWFHQENDNVNPAAIVYRHYDGYPEVENDGEKYGMLPTLAEFFEEVARQTGRVGYDAGHLAAQYVIWQSAEYNRDDDDYRRDAGTGGPLNFSSVYLMREDPGDIEYRYHVYPTPPKYTGTPEDRADDRPRVTYDERIGFTDEWRTVRPQTPEERARAEFLKTWNESPEELRATLYEHLQDQPRLWLSEAEETIEATGDETPDQTDEPLHYGDFGSEEVDQEPDQTPEEEITAGGFQIVERADGLLFSRDPGRKSEGVYEIVRPEVDANHHAVICGDEDHLTVLSYITDGDGFGRSVYCSSKGPYKTIKGARKRARDYLAS